MQVHLLYFAGCRNWQLADERARQAMQQVGMPDDALVLQAVETPEHAERLAFRGSPTVLVDGEDRFADPDAPVGLSCRVLPDARRAGRCAHRGAAGRRPALTVRTT